MSFVYFCSMLQMRQALIVYSVVLIGWIVIIATNHNLSFKTFSFGIELLYFIAMVVLKSHQKEMAQRKIHNRKIIMDFEIKRTNDLLSNLVPPPVL
jgi:positive regulator of sigma E activity